MLGTPSSSPIHLVLVSEGRKNCLADKHAFCSARDEFRSSAHQKLATLGSFHFIARGEQVAKLTKKEILAITRANFGVVLKESELKAVHVSKLEELIAAQPAVLNLGSSSRRSSASSADG